MLCLRVLINAAGKEDAGDSSTIPNRKWSDDLERERLFSQTHIHTQASTQTRLNMYLTIQGKAKKNVAETKHLLQSQPSNASHCFIHLFLPLSVTPLQSESSWT